MSNTTTKPPGIGFGEGHTAQYLTLAEALRQNAEAMEVDLAYLEKKKLPISAASLRIEARCASVALLSAAVCECSANTVLATILTADKFKKEEQTSMPKKWSHLIPEVLKCPPPDTALVQELWCLYETRHAIVHAKATIFSDGDTVRIQGNDPQWTYLTPEVARKFVTLPSRVAEMIPLSASPLCHTVGFSLRHRLPRLPHVHVNEVVELLELVTPIDRRAIRSALERMDAQA